MDIEALNVWLDFLVQKGRDIEEIQIFIESSSSERHAHFWTDALLESENMVERAKKIIFDIIEEGVNNKS